MKAEVRKLQHRLTESVSCRPPQRLLTQRCCIVLGRRDVCHTTDLLTPFTCTTCYVRYPVTLPYYFSLTDFFRFSGASGWIPRWRPVATKLTMAASVARKPGRSPDREVKPNSGLVGRCSLHLPACSGGGTREEGPHTTWQGSAICSARCCPGAGNLLSLSGTAHTCIL